MDIRPDPFIPFCPGFAGHRPQMTSGFGQIPVPGRREEGEGTLFRVKTEPEPEACYMACYLASCEIISAE